VTFTNNIAGDFSGALENDAGSVFVVVRQYIQQSGPDRGGLDNTMARLNCIKQRSATTRL
jgi:hypothetical protein